jgi:gamma-glutamyltranspeptidase/glutathione hydrolase
VKGIQAVLAIATLGWLAAQPALAPDRADEQATPREVPLDWPYPLDAPAAVAEHGMVVSDAPLASRVGLDVLRAGGSAVDAAIATAFALAVVLPGAGNVGGGGFLVAAVGGRELALDFRETAPSAAWRDMYLDDRGEPTERSIEGHLAAGVPGSVAGLWALHQKAGGKPWGELLRPAIRLADEGFEIDAELASDVKKHAERLGRSPAAAQLFLPEGHSLAAGARLKNPDLARTLRLVATRGHAGFYTGETAERIVAEMRRGGGIVSAADLRAYQARWREPVVFDYRGHRIVSMPPPSSGGLTLALIALQLAKYDLRSLGWHTPAALHVQAEAMRRAFAVRNEALGDPDFVDVPRGRLLSPKFAAALQPPISMERATASSLVSGAVPEAEPQHTTHFSVVDRRGNAVAMTTTLNSWFGSAVIVEGAGFLLNNEMDDFASKPGRANQFGLVQGERNAIAPGKRMLSAMTPTIVFDSASRPLLVTGAAGGPHIITAVFELVSNLLDYGLDVGASIRAPRFHHQHLPDVLCLEKGGFGDAGADSLRRLGHHVESFEVCDGGSIAASIERRDGRWWGASDPRAAGLAAGY